MVGPVSPDLPSPHPLEASSCESYSQSPSSPSAASQGRCQTATPQDIVPETFSFDHVEQDVDVIELPQTGSNTPLDPVEMPMVPQIGLGALPRNVTLLPGVDGPSFELLGHHLSRTALSMGNGSTEVNPFISQLTPLCFANSFILELVLCQSANHRAIGDVSELNVAQGYYNKSLSSSAGQSTTT